MIRHTVLFSRADLKSKLNFFTFYFLIIFTLYTESKKINTKKAMMNENAKRPRGAVSCIFARSFRKRLGIPYTCNKAKRLVASGFSKQLQARAKKQLDSRELFYYFLIRDISRTLLSSAGFFQI